MIESCDLDYRELRSSRIDAAFFEDYENTRIVNSFLFNFTKLQDKIGAKLFRKTLYERKEIDDENLPMMDILSLLERLDIVADAREWDELREIRNLLSHEYPFDIEERIENIGLALAGYEKLKGIYANLRRFYFLGRRPETVEPRSRVT